MSKNVPTLVWRCISNFGLLNDASTVSWFKIHELGVWLLSERGAWDGDHLKKKMSSMYKTKILQNPKDLFPVYISLPYCHSDQLIPDLHSVVSITLRPLCSTLVESWGWGKPDMNAEMTLIGLDLSCHDLFGTSAKHRILGHYGSLAAWCWLLKFICLWYLSFKI